MDRARGFRPSKAYARGIGNQLRTRLFDFVAARSKSRVDDNLSMTLDFSRWFAAFLVLLYHVRINVFDISGYGASKGWDWYSFSFVSATSLGHQAVYFFFVISGYLVGGGLLADVGRNRLSASKYALNRAARIYVVLVPAIVLGLSIDLLRVDLYGIDAMAGGEGLKSYSVLTILGNLLSLQTIAVPVVGSNSPLWSLAYEVWYYVIFFLFVYFVFGKKGNKLFVALLLFLSIGLVAAGNFKVLTLFPLWLIGVGARLAGMPYLRSTTIAWAVAAVLALSYNYTVVHLGYLNNILLALAFAHILIAARNSRHAPSIKALRINKRLAALSFSLYVIHAPIIHLVMCLIGGVGNPQLGRAIDDPGGLFIFSSTCTLIIFASLLFSNLTEKQTDVVKGRMMAALGR